MRFPLFKQWFNDKEFTRDWVSNKLERWSQSLSHIQGEIEILEVGTFEGRSAIAFLEMFPQAKITCVDLFGDEKQEGRFDRNLAAYEGRVTKHKGRAIEKMEFLRRKHARYDLIYLDAAKERTGAFVVSVLGWHLCKVGGTMIWDDLVWHKSRAAHMRAEPGSRLFFQTFASCMAVKQLDTQCVAIKRAEWPEVDENAISVSEEA